MTDLVERLRAANADPNTVTSWRDLVKEAAAEIERLKTMTPDDDNDEPPELAEYNKAMQVVRELRTEVERLRAALRTILEVFRDDQGSVWHKEARAALEPKP